MSIDAIESESTGQNGAGRFGDGAQCLSDWKSIARYIGKGVRTAQRWEKERGLPVRRLWPELTTGPKAPVIAIPAELDAWIHRSGVTSRPQAVQAEPEELLQVIAELRDEVQELKQRLAAALAHSTL